MKYFFLFFFLFGLTSCSFSNPFSKDSPENPIPNIDVGGVRISPEGVSVSSEDGNVSVGTDGSVLVEGDSGNVSVGSGGMNIVSGDNTMTVGKDGVSIWTGIKISTTKTDDMEKDPEIQNATKDIDTIFSDIENGGE